MGHKPWDRPWKRVEKARVKRRWRREVDEDTRDATIVLARMLDDDGRRYPLDEVTAELGL